MNPCPGGHQIYNLDRHFLGHHYCILSLSGQCLGVEKKILKDIIHFHYMTYDYTLTLETMARGLRNLQFGITFFCHHYVILSLSGQCLGVEKKTLKDIIHFDFMTDMAKPQHKNPCPGSDEIYNFGNPLLGHHYYTLSMSKSCPGVKNCFLKTYINLTLLS